MLSLSSFACGITCLVGFSIDLRTHSPCPARTLSRPNLHFPLYQDQRTGNRDSYPLQLSPCKHTTHTTPWLRIYSCFPPLHQNKKRTHGFGKFKRDFNRLSILIFKGFGPTSLGIQFILVVQVQKSVKIIQV